KYARRESDDRQERDGNWIEGLGRGARRERPIWALRRSPVSTDYSTPQDVSTSNARVAAPRAHLMAKIVMRGGGHFAHDAPMSPRAADRAPACVRDQGLPGETQ